MSDQINSLPIGEGFAFSDGPPKDFTGTHYVHPLTNEVWTLEGGKWVRQTVNLSDLLKWLKERERITDDREMRAELLSATRALWAGEGSAFKQVLAYLSR